jgi:hypothetical protein
MEEDIELAKPGYAGFDGGEAGFWICECFQMLDKNHRSGSRGQESLVCFRAVHPRAMGPICCLPETLQG